MSKVTVDPSITPVSEAPVTWPGKVTDIEAVPAPGSVEPGALPGMEKANPSAVLARLIGSSKLWKAS